MIIDATENKELNFNTSFSMSKKEFYTHGLKPVIEASLNQLFNVSLDNFISMVNENLKDEGNQYQFVLTIRKID